jgi:hypothetical protein
MFYLIDYIDLHHGMFIEHVVIAWNNKLVALIGIRLVANGSSMPYVGDGC